MYLETLESGKGFKKKKSNFLRIALCGHQVGVITSTGAST